MSQVHGHDFPKQYRAFLPPKGSFLLLGVLLGFLLGVFLVACKPTPTPTPAPSGAVPVTFVSGKAVIRRAVTKVKEPGQGEMILHYNDQITAKEGITATLRLADGSVLHLSPDTLVQLIEPFPPETRPIWRLQRGKIVVEVRSPDLLVDINQMVPVSFVMKPLVLKVYLEGGEAVFQLWITSDEVYEAIAHLEVLEGQISVAVDDTVTRVTPGTQAHLLPGEPLEVVMLPPTPTPTPALTPTPTVEPSPNPLVTAAITATVSPSPTVTIIISATPTPTPTIGFQPTPSPSPTSTPSPTPTPALPLIYPAPLLLEPPDGAIFGLDRTSLISLVWLPRDALEPDHWYEVQLWREGEEPRPRYWTKDNWWDIGPDPAYYPGVIHWRVFIVLGKGENRVGPLSFPSEERVFEWWPVRPTDTPAPPPPTPTPTRRPTPTATPTATPIPSPTSTFTPIPTPTLAPTNTPRPIPCPTP